MYNTAVSNLVLSHCNFCSLVPSSSTHPLPFPFLGSCLTAVPRTFPKILLLHRYPFFPPSSISPLIFLHPPFSPSPVLLSGMYQLTGIHLLASPPLLTFSYFFRWYHGHLSGAAAESLLQAKATPWTFLVRESLSKPGDFVLSVLTDQPKPGSDAPPAGATSASGARLKVTHIKIMCEVSKWESKRRREYVFLPISAISSKALSS